MSRPLFPLVAAALAAAAMISCNSKKETGYAAPERIPSSEAEFLENRRLRMHDAEQTPVVPTLHPGSN